MSEGSDAHARAGPAERARKRWVTWKRDRSKETNIMLKPKLLLASLAAASAFAAIPLPASAAVGVYVDVAPPPPRYEVVPAPRRGFVWDPGYWEWRHGRYIWARGHWVRERHGMYWHPSHWVERDGRWVLERGGWHRERWEARHYARRDSDHDGVPNRFDPAPHDPYIR
jgi:hypothetical protein